MSKRGILIVFEGLDGSGKGTQLKLFQEFLENQNQIATENQIRMFREHIAHAFGKNQQFGMFTEFLKDQHLPFATYDFPRYYENFWGKMVGRMLTGEFGKNPNPYLRSIFYVLDQAAACKQIKKDLQAGKIVICNRYITSSMIFQTAQFKSTQEKKAYLDWLETAGYRELGMVKPDVVLALYVKPEKAQELVLKKEARKYTNGAEKDINEKNLQLQINAGKEMLKLCKERTNWHLVDCMQGNELKSPEQISQEIRDLLENYIN
jgi:dTMP kinase